MEMYPVNSNVNIAQWGGVPVGAIDGDGFSKVSTGTAIDATVVKAGPVTLTGLIASNVNAAARYVKLYDQITVPDPVTDVPKLVLLVPGGTTGGTNRLELGNGVKFLTGLAYTMVTTAPNTGATGVAASEVILNGSYR